MECSNFERHEHAPDGIHGTMEFAEFHDARWWTSRALRRQALRTMGDRIAPFAIAAAMLAAFALISILENSL